MLAAHIRHFFEILFSPFVLGFMLLAFSTFWLFLRGDGYVARGGFLLSLLGFWLFGTGWLPVAVTKALENQYRVVLQPNRNVHWIVVFGGGHFLERVGAPANEELAPESIERLVEAVRLYRLIPNAKLILSGGPGTTGTISEAAYLAVVASWFAIPLQDMILEKESFNTREQSIAIKKLLHKEPFYLVTSAIHMPRAMALCQQQGLHPIAAPVSQLSYRGDSHWEKMIFPNHASLAQMSAAWHEILGLLWGKLRGLV